VRPVRAVRPDKGRTQDDGPWQPLPYINRPVEKFWGRCGAPAEVGCDEGCVSPDGLVGVFGVPVAVVAVPVAVVVAILRLLSRFGVAPRR
jgi:hypothetical protein